MIEELTKLMTKLMTDSYDQGVKDALESVKEGLDALPKREWVGLTNDEVNEFAAGCHLGKSVQNAIYEAEAKLKENNT